MIVNPLKALNGDCIILSSSESKNKTNILIDGGPKIVYKESLKKQLLKIIESKEKLEYIFITHVDNDHIAGIIELINDIEIAKQLQIKEIFFNYYDRNTQYVQSNNISYRQGDRLSFCINRLNEELKKEELPEIKIRKCKRGDNILLGNINIKVVSPSIEEINTLYEDWGNSINIKNQISSNKDYSVNINDFKFNNESKKITTPNLSSIGFIAIENDKSVLFTGDASPLTIVDGLTKLGYSKNKKLKLDLMKLSHHGGENSINFDLLKLIDCDKYLITTNGRTYNHPRKKTLAQIIKYKECEVKNINNEKKKLYFYFNYKRDVFNENDKSLIKFKCMYEDILKL